MEHGGRGRRIQFYAQCPMLQDGVMTTDATNF